MTQEPELKLGIEITRQSARLSHNDYEITICPPGTIPWRWKGKMEMNATPKALGKELAKIGEAWAKGELATS
jgi:hypothetical protein